jgi:hypothetical protein
MPLGCHDIIPRVQPMFYNVAKEHADAASIFCVL